MEAYRAECVEFVILVHTHFTSLELLAMIRPSKSSAMLQQLLLPADPSIFRLLLVASSMCECNYEPIGSAPSFWVHGTFASQPLFLRVLFQDQGGGFVGFERTTVFADSFDLLVFCYSQQCSTLSAGVPVQFGYCIIFSVQSIQRACTVQFFY